MFESQPGHRLTENFMVSLVQRNAGILRLGRDRSLLNPIQFIIQMIPPPNAT
jgi:hypothetical protein